MLISSTTLTRPQQRAVHNANNGTALLQTADLSIEQSAPILQRLRMLAIPSPNGLYTNSDRMSWTMCTYKSH
ncbi:MAG TPA: hypothetical protein PKD17_02440 [Cellvibrionaceae bacterium]|nr:hypothetical protein [Cellvibrionaceae bacterium]HMW70648.1 hypothetical protein [Cellvibrionaceae bacterium]HMY38039.1 hypothetical protein [Marinagarivorans sp.]HNG59307.1 hypothetical protein [Cellvibrionaceae bacterium]